MFTTPFDVVLSHREHLEEQARFRLAEEIRRVADIEAQLVECAQAMRSAGELWSHELEDGISVPRLAIIAEWSEEIRRRRADLTEKRRGGQHGLDEARQALTEAHREVRKFQHLRDRALRQHLADVARREHRDLDDQVLMRHGRRHPNRRTAQRREAP